MPHKKVFTLSSSSSSSSSSSYSSILFNFSLVPIEHSNKLLNLLELREGIVFNGRNNELEIDRKIIMMMIIIISRWKTEKKMCCLQYYKLTPNNEFVLFDVLRWNSIGCLHVDFSLIFEDNGVAFSFKFLTLNMCYFAVFHVSSNNLECFFLFKIETVKWGDFNIIVRC